MAIVVPVDTTDGRRHLRVASPATQQVTGDISVTSADDVRAAVARARAAQPAWAATSFAERAAIMRRAAEILRTDQARFIDVIRRDTGRSQFESLMMEVFPALDSLTYYAKHAAAILGDRRPGLHLLRTKKLLVTYRPLGVVGIITPWNGPFILGLNPTVQALMAGNAVLLKPSEVTPFAGALVGELLAEAGLPADVLQIVQGDGATGAALVDGGVDKISFTGSVATGRKVGEACGRNLIPCTLELGGKDAMIVCDDADLERAAGGAVFGAFFNAGQFCCGTERVYVHQAIADAFIQRVVEKTRALRQGTDGEFDVGPMIWPRQLDTIERHMADAVARGATVRCGGRRNVEAGELCYEPTVLTDVTHDMLIMQDETFGPILPIVVVADDDEAIRLANDSRYGLSGTVW
ncbi:MAG: aldehyde dehydrogenase family protein, partial [Myxococcales bacterium]|nr:aldehyde dehydrogenase family protein [Myxococcales bacterium]